MAITAIVQGGTLTALVQGGTLTALVQGEVVVPTGGVKFEGEQGIVDLRGITGPDHPTRKSRQQLIRTVGKVSRQHRLRTSAKLIQDTAIQLFSKISQSESITTLSKLAMSNKFRVTGRITKDTIMETKSEPDHAGAAKHLQDILRKEKIKKIRKLFKEYKDTTEDD